MSTRREFIQVGIAATTVVVAHGLSAAEPASMQASVPNGAFYKIVYDSDFPAAVAFANEARRRGASTHGIRGDVTNLWYQDLSRQWAHSPTPVAGMTTYQSMFVLAQMARDARMRLVYQVTHRPATDGAVKHRCHGPVAFLNRYRLPETETAEVWARAAAGAVMEWQAEPMEIELETTIGAACEHSVDTQTLVSWIIASVRPAYRSARRSLLQGNWG